VNIHEYQAKQVLAGFGVPVPAGRLARTVEEARDAARELGGEVWAVKAQIHAGGRGKAGGVHVCRSLDDVTQAAQALLGSRLVTRQTGPEGRLVRKVYVEQGLAIAREVYLSLLVDRDAEAVAFVASPDGGMEIEEVAARTPERILTRPVRISRGVSEADIAALAAHLGFSEAADFAGILEGLYRAFVERDCSLIELNPLVLTDDGALLALDAKMAVDDNALFRQPEMAAMRDPDEEDPREAEAAAFGLNYIQLDGDIGCMVNGAGLAMATMDMVKLKGASPANFLDVGGGVTEEAVTEAFRLLFSDEHVKAVLVNIFGGIVRCDIIARGLLEAVKTHPARVPVVMRLVGTNEEEGRHLLREADLPVRWANDLDEAAGMAAEIALNADMA